MEISNITIGTRKRNEGELVLEEDRIVVYTCERKLHILPPTNLRAVKLFEIPIGEIYHITYDPGILIIKYPTITIFLKPEFYKKYLEKIKQELDFWKFLVRENGEYKLQYGCPKVPEQISKKFVEKAMQLKEGK